MVRAPYRAAVRLLELAAHYWAQIDAHYYQIDLLELPIYRQFNMIYSWFLGRFAGNEEALERFEEMLAEPFDWEKRQRVITASTADDEIAMMRAAAGEF